MFLQNTLRGEKKMRKLDQQFEMAIENMQHDVIDLIKALCAIPAPSHHEQKRAAFIKDWFIRRDMKANGA